MECGEYMLPQGKHMKKVQQAALQLNSLRDQVL